MKTKFLVLISLVLFSIGLVSCSVEILDNKSSDILSIKGDILTRNVKSGTSFDINDQIGVFVVNNGGAISSNCNNALASFNGVNWNFPNNVIHLTSEESRVYAYYPYAVSNSLNKVNVDLKPNGTKGQSDYLYGVGLNTVNASSPEAKIQFKFALSRITLKITKNTNDSLSLDSVILNNSAYSTAIASKGMMDITTGYITKIPDYNASVGVSVSKVLSCDSSISVDILVIPTTIKENAEITLMINGTKISVPVPDIIWESGCQYTYPITFTKISEKKAKLVIGQSSIVAWNNTTESQNTITSSNIDKSNLTVGGTIGNMVDLGLSVKWADHNMGASKPEEYGGYYIWNSNGASPLPKLISGTTFDLVHTQWGQKWRLPTYLEVKELIDNCTFSESTLNGVKGMIILSKVPGFTDKSIFIPYSGFKFYDGGYLKTVDTGSNLYLWTGVLEEDLHYSGMYEYAATSYVLKAYGTYSYISSMECSSQAPIRPVTE